MITHVFCSLGLSTAVLIAGFVALTSVVSPSVLAEHSKIRTAVRGKPQRIFLRSFTRKSVQPGACSTPGYVECGQISANAQGLARLKDSGPVYPMTTRADSAQRRSSSHAQVITQACFSLPRQGSSFPATARVGKSWGSDASLREAWGGSDFTSQH